MTEAELRQQGLESWDKVIRCFNWYELSKDFERELVGHNKKFRIQLEHELLMDMHGWSEHASIYYKNMSIYLQAGLAEEKQLEYYLDQIKQMYWQKLQTEKNVRRDIVRFVDGTGRVLETFTI